MKAAHATGHKSPPIHASGVSNGKGSVYTVSLSLSHTLSLSPKPSDEEIKTKVQAMTNLSHVLSTSTSNPRARDLHQKLPKRVSILCSGLKASSQLGLTAEQNPVGLSFAHHVAHGCVHGDAPVPRSPNTHGCVTQPIQASYACNSLDASKL